jgi:hypothetical protein
MPFSPEIYGTRATTALNALSDSEQSFGWVMFTKTEGTAFEADLLLSCSGLYSTPVCRLLDAINSGKRGYNLVGGFLGKQPRKISVLNHFNGKLPSAQGVRFEVMVLLRRLRRSIPRSVSTTRSGPAFTDAKFGPRVAKVLNALLALEIAVVGNTGVDQGTYVFNITFARARVLASWDERPAFALGTEEGTEFAAELLLHQAGSLEFFIEDAKERGEGFGIVDALFPTYGAVPTEHSDFFPCFQGAVMNCHREMYTLLVVVIDRTVPVLMAGVHHLGRNSPLAKLDQSVLQMIVQMVIADVEAVARVQQ